MQETVNVNIMRNKNRRDKNRSDFMMISRFVPKSHKKLDGLIFDILVLERP